MPRRKILTPRKRDKLLSLPADQAHLMKFYILSEDDLELISKKRRNENKVGFALQLCALRYPGRLLEKRETIPPETLKFITSQIKISSKDVYNYGMRRQTRQEHLEELRLTYGYSMFYGEIVEEIRSWLFEHAINSTSSEALLYDFISECRKRRIILPAISTIERLCADAMVATERYVEAEIVSRLHSNNYMNLDALLDEQLDNHISRFIWLRQFELGNNSSGMNRLLDRLEFIHTLKIDYNILENIPPHHITRLRQLGKSYFSHNLKEVSTQRRLAILTVCVIEWQLEIADAVVETHDRIVGRTWRDAQRSCILKLEANKGDINDTLSDWVRMGTDLIKARNTQQPLKQAIPWDDLKTLVMTAKELMSTTSSTNKNNENSKTPNRRENKRTTHH